MLVGAADGDDCTPIDPLPYGQPSDEVERRRDRHENQRNDGGDCEPDPGKREQRCPGPLGLGGRVVQRSVLEGSSIAQA